VSRSAVYLRPSIAAGKNPGQGADLARQMSGGRPEVPEVARAICPSAPAIDAKVFFTTGRFGYSPPGPLCWLPRGPRLGNARHLLLRDDRVGPHWPILSGQ
jgi:hypothetical protein